MIYIRRAGELTRNGFNFYPLSDKYSRGFILRLGRFSLRVRYSSFQERLIVSMDHPSWVDWSWSYPRQAKFRTQAERDQMLFDCIDVRPVDAP